MIDKYTETKPIKTQSYVYDLHYHLVWVTKYRFHAFTDEKIINSLSKKIQDIADSNEITIEAMEIMPDHIHLLISAKPKLSITSIVKSFKGSTGKWLLKEFPIMQKHFRHGHVWSSSYFVGSVGNTNKEIVEKYINSQKERPFK